MKATALQVGLVGIVAGLLAACDLSAEDKKVLSNSTDRFGQHATQVIREVGPPSRRVSQAPDDVFVPSCRTTFGVATERYVYDLPRTGIAGAIRRMLGTSPDIQIVYCVDQSGMVIGRSIAQIN